MRGADGSDRPRRAERARGLQTTAVERLGAPLAYSRGLRIAILACTLLGAVILVAAEFSTLYTVRAAGHSAIIQSTTAGADNSYALIPLAVLAVVLGVAALAEGAGRWVVAALMLAGVIALLIGLLHDLPAAHRTGFVGSFHTHLTSAASSPGAGMYMETLGALLLIVAGGLGLLFGEPVEQVRPRAAASAPPGTTRVAGSADPDRRTPRSAPAGERAPAGGGAKRPASSRAKGSGAGGAAGAAPGSKRSASKAAAAAGTKRSSTAAKRGSAAGAKTSSARRKPAQGSGAKGSSGSPAEARPAGAKRPAGGGPKRGGGGAAKRGSGSRGQGGSGAGAKPGPERGADAAQAGTEADKPPESGPVSEN